MNELANNLVQNIAHYMSIANKFMLLTDQSTADQTKMAASTEQPPAVPTRKTQDGLCFWSELYLPPPPPMYRPFMHQEEDQIAVVKKRSGKTMKDRKASQAEGDIKGNFR